MQHLQHGQYTQVRIQAMKIIIIIITPTAAPPTPPAIAPTKEERVETSDDAFNN